MIKHLFRFTLILLPVLFSTNIHSNDKVTPSHPYLDKISKARVVIIGKVQSIRSIEVSDDYDESFDLIKIKGNIIDSTGTRSRNDVVMLRSLTGAFDQYSRGRYVFALTGKDLEADTYEDRFPWLVTPVLQVKRNNLYSDNNLLVNIDSEGYLDFNAFNNCDISDFPVESEITLVTDTGEIFKEFTREEILDSVDSFECPDGSQWVRGLYGKDRSRKDGIKLKSFENILTAHLKLMGVPKTSDDEITRDVKRGPSSLVLDIETTKTSDEPMIQLIEDSRELRDKVNYKYLKRIFKRIENRRKKYRDGEISEAIGIVDWDEYPNVKKLLKKHKLMN